MPPLLVWKIRPSWVEPYRLMWARSGPHQFGRDRDGTCLVVGAVLGAAFLPRGAVIGPGRAGQAHWGGKPSMGGLSERQAHKVRLPRATPALATAGVSGHLRSRQAPVLCREDGPPPDGGIGSRAVRVIASQLSVSGPRCPATSGGKAPSRGLGGGAAGYGPRWRPEPREVRHVPARTGRHPPGIPYPAAPGRSRCSPRPPRSASPPWTVTAATAHADANVRIEQPGDRGGGRRLQLHGDRPHHARPRRLSQRLHRRRL